MRIVIVEYVLAGGLGDQPLEAALLREACEMVSGLVEDITLTPGPARLFHHGSAADADPLAVAGRTPSSRLDVVSTTPAPPSGPCAPPQRRLDALATIRGGKTGLEVSVAVEPRMANGIAPSLRITRRDGEALPAFWRRAALSGDAVLPVAPETGGALEQLTRLLADTGVPVLGSRPEAVALAASKHRTASTLKDAGVSVVTTLRPEAAPKARAGGWVIKPDDGVSCQGLRLLGGTEDTTTIPPDFVVQPWLPGIPASLSLLCHANGARVLSGNRQVIERVGTNYVYCGSEVAAFPLQARHHRLAAAVYQAIPGLYGFVGIDFIINGGKLTVLEVNPRLTTSCAGLRKATGIGLGTWITQLLAGLPAVGETGT